MRSFILASTGFLLVSCASQVPPSTPAAVPQVSPECLAAKLRAVDPLPASAIPDEILRKAQSGWVAVSYDVVAGKAQNVKVAASNPPGLYDAYVLRHTGNYTEPSGATVRGCISTTNIKF
jgi:hypothetical protein